MSNLSKFKQIEIGEWWMKKNLYDKKIENILN